MSTARTIDVATVIDGRRLNGFNYTLIVVSWLITVFDGFDMMMISFTAPYMRDELHLDTLMLGNVFSAGIFGMLLGGFFFAYLGDRIGRRPTIISAAFAFGVLTLATAFARNYGALLVLRFLDGFAIGGMLPLAWALNIEYVPRRYRSTIVTVIMMGYSLGTSMAGPLTVWLAPKFGWEGVFVFGGISTLICASLLFLVLPESVRFLTSKNRRPALIAATLNRLDPGLRATAGDDFELSDEPKVARHFHVSQLFEGRLRWLTPFLWLGYTISSLAIYFSSSWGPIVLEALDFSRNTAAYVSSVSGFAGAIAGLALMRFTDKHGPISVAFYPILAITFLLVLGLVPMSQGTFLPLSIVGTALVGGAHFGIVSIAGVFYPSAVRANGAGWATSIAKAGAIVGPLIGAAVLASGVPAVRNYALLAVCPAVLAVAAVGIALVLRNHRRTASVVAAPVPAS